MGNDNIEESVKRSVRRVPRVLTDSNNSGLVSKLFEVGILENSGLLFYHP